MGLEGLCGPDESTLLPSTGAYGTRSTGEREPIYAYICIYTYQYIYLYIYISIYIYISKKNYTIYNSPIQANSTKMFGAVNKASKTKN